MIPIALMALADAAAKAQAIAPATPSWWDLAKQVPALALLVFVVVHFLRHLEKIDEAHRQDVLSIATAHEKRVTAVALAHAERLEDLTTEYRGIARQTIALHERVLLKLDQPA